MNDFNFKSVKACLSLGFLGYVLPPRGDGSFNFLLVFNKHDTHRNADHAFARFFRHISRGKCLLKPEDYVDAV